MSPGGAGVRIKSVDVSTGGGAISSIPEEVGAVLEMGGGSGGASELVDEVFEESNTRGEGTKEEAVGGRKGFL